MIAGWSFTVLPVLLSKICWAAITANQLTMVYKYFGIWSASSNATQRTRILKIAKNRVLTSSSLRSPQKRRDAQGDRLPYWHSVLPRHHNSSWHDGKLIYIMDSNLCSIKNMIAGWSFTSWAFRFAGLTIENMFSTDDDKSTDDGIKMSFDCNATQPTRICFYIYRPETQKKSGVFPHTGL